MRYLHPFSILRLVSIFEATARACRSLYDDALPFIRKYCSAHKEHVYVPPHARRITLEWLRSKYGFYQYKPMHFNDAVKFMLSNSNSLDTSPGITFRSLGYKTKREVLENDSCIGKLHSMMHAVKKYEAYYTPIVFACVMKAKEILGQVKARFAFVMPIQVLIAETMLFGPLIRDLPVDWVPTPKTHHDRFCGNKSKSFDFASFDSSVPRELIRAAFDIFVQLIDFEHYEGYGTPSNLEELFLYVENVYLHTRVRVPQSDRVFQLNHGVPSGGLVTNLLDTVISRLVIETLHDEECESISTTYGDDCHSVNCSCDNDLLVDRAKALFGMDLKIIPPNELGCLTFCKCECIMGHPFHSGQWFKDIIDTTEASILPDVIECLTHMSPTKDQAAELLTIAQDCGPTNPHPALLRKVSRMREFLVGVNFSPQFTSL
uniref:RdRp n=1 Tax=Hubei coleoptera virus 4 TaxID=1922863 RepID=A0A1L3KLC8_9VIRU|nr:RdRp [Hubei coleoptera virus 4]